MNTLCGVIRRRGVDLDDVVDVSVTSLDHWLLPVVPDERGSPRFHSNDDEDHLHWLSTMNLYSYVPGLRLRTHTMASSPSAGFSTTLSLQLEKLPRTSSTYLSPPPTRPAA